MVPEPVPSPGDQSEGGERLPQQEEFYRAPARFGSIPVEAEPKGWDRRQRFEKHYPRIDLPTQIIERVKMGNEEPHEPNRLIWGDNLHVMRQIPSNSVDLIYIDPPFFSGRNYNVLWGDNNELRSFEDIWEGGMDGYLIWLNARLYEMKRLLKPTGSIYVHCDWHASHYIKVEMDKIFGYGSFRNEIVWRRGTGVSRTDTGQFLRNHDVLVWYSKQSGWAYRRLFKPYAKNTLAMFNHDDKDGRGSYRLQELRTYSNKSIARFREENRTTTSSTGREYLKQYLSDKEGNTIDSIWDDIGAMNTGASPERIGYPTQKPEALLERIIKTSSNEGDVILDAFVGGGTTAVAALQLQRRFIGIDQSRVAVAVTTERLKQQAVTRGLEGRPIPDFTVEQWGIYEAERLSQMPIKQFRDFVLRAYGATRIGHPDDGPDVHGWRNQLPIWVGEPTLVSQASGADVQTFANAVRQTPQYRQANLRDGVMLAWGFGPDAAAAADQLREREEIDVNFVRLKQVRIGDADFREHIVRRSTDKADYSDFLTFVQPPVVNLGWRALGGGSVTFDAGDSAVINPGAEIINVQWDFAYDGARFIATPGYSFQRDKKPQLRVTHTFAQPGKRRVACRVQDSRGGEGLKAVEVEVR